jgi:hypothetical protein
MTTKHQTADSPDLDISPSNIKITSEEKDKETISLKALQNLKSRRNKMLQRRKVNKDVMEDKVMLSKNQLYL